MDNILHGDGGNQDPPDGQHQADEYVSPAFMDRVSGSVKAFRRPAWLRVRPGFIAIPICLLLAPLLPLMQQGIFLSLAMSLRAMGRSLVFKNMFVELGGDPVYASVLNRTLGNIDPRGLAVAGPAGNLLHQIAPQAFASPEKVAAGAWATALLGNGASLLASALAAIGAEVILVVIGLVLLWAGLRIGRVNARAGSMLLLLIGLMLQARGIQGLLSLRFSVEDVEIMGLSHVFTKIIPMDADSYSQMMAGPLMALITGLLPMLPIIVLYGALVLVLLWRGKLRRWLHPREWLASVSGLASRLRPVPAFDGRRVGLMVPLVMATLVGGVLSQGVFPVSSDYQYSVRTEAPMAEAQVEPAPAPALTPATPTPTEAPKAKQAVIAGPSRVYVTGSNNNYSYTVNGLPQKLRGVGYNPMYSQLSLSERAARYDRDFGQMKAVGINTILGWDKEQFDGLLLQKAQEYGVGVILPYHLTKEVDYANPVYSQALRQSILAWVMQYKDYPALRMWGIGNEVIHSMGRNPDTPQARAFAQFYVKLVDEVHSLDADHPVTYRDAEDMYLGPIREVLRKDGVGRPWFVYGMNFFTPRICQASQDWPKREMPVPAMISEFAPSGLSPDDRAKAYVQMHSCVARHPSTVLGGFAYVWFTNGPEAIDRVMGLVDAQGRPVDGSLQALGKAFRNELE